jgi:hypothetical protein
MIALTDFGAGVSCGIIGVLTLAAVLRAGWLVWCALDEPDNTEDGL